MQLGINTTKKGQWQWDNIWTGCPRIQNSKITSSDADGFFEFTGLGADTYVILAKKKGYKKTKQIVKLGDAESTEIEIEMRKTSKRIKGLIQEEDVQ